MDALKKQGDGYNEMNKKNPWSYWFYRLEIEKIYLYKKEAL